MVTIVSILVLKIVSVYTHQHRVDTQYITLYIHNNNLRSYIYILQSPKWSLYSQLVTTFTMIILSNLFSVKLMHQYNRHNTEQSALRSYMYTLHYSIHVHNCIQATLLFIILQIKVPK